MDKQDIVKKVLGADNIEATMTTALTAQGKAPQGARMQLQFILACSKSKMVRNPARPTLATDIIRTHSQRVERYGESAYPLSEKQIAAIARHFGKIIVKE